ncbi:unnamed protein product [Cochlearia groenlandica]
MNSIPIDLVMEILSRLPTKSIARCRCVSKLWASILRREDFTELFLTRSSSVPRLLFAFHTFNDRELLFFSTPQLQENSSSLSLAAASYHMKIPYTSTVFQLGILQDVEKGEWSDHTYVLSDSLRDRFMYNFVDFVGVTRSNELVLAPHYKIPGRIEPFYIYYYNLDKNTTLEIGIPGTEALRDVRVYTSIDYVENVRSIT